jgi:hypothetical protein
MKALLILLICLAGQYTPGYTQHTVSGKISDRGGDPVPGANIYLEGSYDGVTAGADGRFHFQTRLSGSQTLVASHIGYAAKKVMVILEPGLADIDIILQESASQLEGVTITAGNLQASAEMKNAVLRPLDIAMTAGATADITGALNTLPGTQRVGEDGRLFVRGGTPEETKVLIDGLHVVAPYNSSLPNLPTRNRFSPFMFKGTTFSTGGYSAEYGQALSSVLLLETRDIPPQRQTDISLMTVGLGLAHTEAGNRSSVTLEGSYTNLWPYFALIPQQVSWTTAPRGWGLSGMYRQKVRRSGLWKTYVSGSSDRMHTGAEQPAWISASTYLRNDFLQLNSSYREIRNEKLGIYAGLAFNLSRDEVRPEVLTILKKRMGGHLKAGIDYQLNHRIALKAGQEFLPAAQKLHMGGRYAEGQNWSDLLSATYGETEIAFSGRSALRAGGRLEYSALTRRFNAAPRIAFAHKISATSQLSAAWGIFYQHIRDGWLGILERPDYERARHVVINYQWNKNDRLFRAEIYHKEYRHLLRTNGDVPAGLPADNSGNGYARGLELFWRDRKTLKNADYWISYSFLDSRRHHLGFPSAATPDYASAHNFSAVVKQFITPLRTQIGLTYSFASGRPYTDPNQPGFLNALTPSYHDLSANLAYLIRPNIILYLSGSNLPGFDNIFGYRYNASPGADGRFAREAIRPAAPRFLFAGLFITLSGDGQSNQLDNL